MNSTHLIGRLYSTPVLRKTASGSDLLRFTLKVERDNPSSEAKQNTDYIPCLALNNRAKAIADNCHKGDRLGIDGRLQSRTHEDETGKKHNSMEVFIEKFDFLTPRISKADQAALSSNK